MHIINSHASKFHTLEEQMQNKNEMGNLLNWRLLGKLIKVKMVRMRVCSDHSDAPYSLMK